MQMVRVCVCAGANTHRNAFQVDWCTRVCDDLVRVEGEGEFVMRPRQRCGRLI